MKLYLLLIISCTSMLISGCGYIFGKDGFFRDRSHDYLKAKTIPRTQVPGNLDDYVLDDMYVVPELTQLEKDKLPGEFDVPRPEAILAKLTSIVRVQKIGDRQWIALSYSPEAVWPNVRSYWEKQSVKLEYENPASGVMYTEWLDHEVESAQEYEYQEKYRVRIERGLREGSSEVHITHIKLPKQVPAKGMINWPDKSHDYEKESEVISALSKYLNFHKGGNATVSLMAQGIGGKKKAALIEENGLYRAIHVHLDYARAWAAVAYALKEAQISVDDKNRSDAIFFISILWDGEEINAVSNGMMKKMLSFGSKEDIYRFQIKLNALDDMVKITVVEPDNVSVSRDIQQQLLKLIKANLS